MRARLLAAQRPSRIGFSRRATPVDQRGMPSVTPVGTLGSSLVSPLRESFERASAPILQTLAGLPRVVPFLLVLALMVAGVIIEGWGWILVAVVTLFLIWLLLLGWPRLSAQERLMRVAVVAIAAAVTITQAIPN
ncbi:DUF6703 family protein [Knoellia sp. S7-12]|uniref:DUF6703 family protein n=1 Tax=Knoellia sp. S7-12 TaxID=3126698 RepID=UPI0033683F2D